MSRPTDAGPAYRTRLPILALATALVALSFATAAAAQEDESRELFVDTVDVNVVNLEVMVTDRDGNPVRGLTRDDFVVTEDGEPVELTNFYAVESARRVQPPERPSADGYSVPELLPLPEDQTLNLALVLDVENLQAIHRNRVIDQIKAEVERVVRPGDRVMVATLAPNPEIELPFTSDVVAVSTTLDRIARARAGGHTELAVLLRQIEREFSNMQSDQFGSTQVGRSAESADTPADMARRAEQMIINYANQADYHLRRTFAGIDALIASMSGLPGRKSVLYVSEGLTTRPGEQLYEALVSSYPEIAREIGSAQFATNRWDASDLLQDLARNASANRVVFYTLDAKGVADGSARADSLGLPALGANVDISTHDTMMHLAASTGGDTMINPAAASKLLDRMADDFSEYYSLGYVSPNERDGEFHRLEVKVRDRNGVRVRHNEGYRASTIEQEMLDRTISALVLDVADNPLDVRVELGDPQPDKKDQFVLPVLVKVPVAKLVLVPQQREHKGKLALYVAVRDSEGRMSKPQRFEIPVDIPNENLLSAMSREVGYGMNLLVRGGDAKLAVGVRDEVGAVTSTVNLNVSVGADKVAAK